MPKHMRQFLPVLLALILIFTVFAVVQAQDSSPEKKADIYLFWGDGCPHCAEEKPVLEALAEKYPGVVLHFYEVWYDQANQDLMVEMGDKFGFEPSAVPTTFIGGQYWTGYNEQVSREIEAQVLACLQDGCPDAGAGVISPLSPEQPAPHPLKQQKHRAGKPAGRGAHPRPPADRHRQPG